MGVIKHRSSPFYELEQTGALEQNPCHFGGAPVQNINWSRLEHWSAKDALKVRSSLLQSSRPAQSSHTPFRGGDDWSTGANWSGLHPGVGNCQYSEAVGRSELERVSGPHMSGDRAPVRGVRVRCPMADTRDRLTSCERPSLLRPLARRSAPLPGAGTVHTKPAGRAGTTPVFRQSQTLVCMVDGVDVVDSGVVGRG
ncbi:hypothetical protein SAMN05880590_10180 [Rhizobium sp. RU35A]|nr:hypothetical protein SAMN05880590_10180 [Rhizobium sp. RU35A]